MIFLAKQPIYLKRYTSLQLTGVTGAEGIDQYNYSLFCALPFMWASTIHYRTWLVTSVYLCPRYYLSY